MDVAQNVGYGLRQKKVGKEEERRRASQALELVRLCGYERRRTWELSGGQQQRVALARALVNRPTVLLLDEPLGALDLKLRKQMQLELKALQQEVGITFVYVTHDQEEALTMSDVIVVMLDGRIQQLGGPEELYEQPVNRFVADFIGVSNPIPGRDRRLRQSPLAGQRSRRTAASTLAGRVTETRARARQRDDVVDVAVRPERLAVEPATDATRRASRRLDGRPGPHQPGNLSGRTDGVPDRHRPGGRADRPPPERHRHGRRDGPRPGGSRRRPMARGCQPRPRWMRLAVTCRTDRAGRHRPGLTGPEGGGERGATGTWTRSCSAWRGSKVSRRGFLQGSTLAATSAFLAACSATRAVAAAAERIQPGGTPSPSFAVPADIEKELFMYNWADYVDTGSMALFQQVFGVEKFTYDTFESNETMLAKLQAGGVGQYDFGAPTAEYTPGMVEEGMIQKIDWSKIPNQKYINAKFKGLWWDPNDEYQLPKDWGTTGITKRGKFVTEPVKTWKEFFDVAPKYSGKIIVVDSMGDVFTAPLKALGYSLNSVDPGELK